MRQLDEIISILDHGSGSLSDALLKTKVLVRQIDQPDIAAWATAELNGYSDETVVPPYRILNSTLKGDVMNVRWLIRSTDLPTGHLTEEWRGHFLQVKMRESVAVLERYSKSENALRCPHPPELCSMVSKAYDSGHVQSMWSEIQPTQVVGVLTEIRSRLLDFALDLQTSIGELDGEAARKVAKNLDASSMFSQAIIGDNATIIFGSHNTTTIQNSVKKGDFQSLADELIKHGMAPSDVEHLHHAIEADRSISHGGSFGPAVKDWIGKMMTKAANASWPIELGIAANLLTNCLVAYYS